MRCCMRRGCVECQQFCLLPHLLCHVPGRGARGSSGRPALPPSGSGGEWRCRRPCTGRLLVLTHYGCGQVRLHAAPAEQAATLALGAAGSRMCAAPCLWGVRGPGLHRTEQIRTCGRRPWGCLLAEAALECARVCCAHFLLAGFCHCGGVTVHQGLVMM